MAVTTRISRFEAIPFNQPAHYAVGFSIRADNGREVYLEGLVPLTEASGKTDQQIAELAYAQIKATAETEIARLRSQSALIGQVFETEEMRQEQSQSKNGDMQQEEDFPGGRRSETAQNDHAERSSADEQPDNGDIAQSRRRQRRTSQ